MIQNIPFNNISNHKSIGQLLSELSRSELILLTLDFLILNAEFKKCPKTEYDKMIEGLIRSYVRSGSEEIFRVEMHKSFLLPLIDGIAFHYSDSYIIEVFKNIIFSEQEFEWYSVCRTIESYKYKDDELKLYNLLYR